MFSLIITIISVALVAALALATLFYGGESYQSGQAKAEAAKLRNQGQQLVAAAEFFYLQRGAWPDSIQEMVDSGHLNSIPVAQRAAVQEALAAKQWQMPRGGQPLFVFDEVTVEVCRTINQESYGLAGILPKLQAGYMHQCFGPTKNDLLVVVGRGSLPDLVAAVNDGLLTPENVSSDPVPSADDTAAWTVAPGGDDGAGGGVPQPEPGVVAFSPAAVAFGPVATHFSETQDVTLSNTSGQAVALGTPAVTGDDGFAVVSTTCGQALAAGEACVVTLTYAPTVGAQNQVGTLSVGESLSASLSASAYNPVSLQSAALPTAKLNRVYTPVSFSDYLDVSNEETPDLGPVAWEAQGTLPAGLSFDDQTGTLSGTPTALTAQEGQDFTVLATYKNNQGQQVYTIRVGEAVLEAVSISAGSVHTCAVTNSGGVKCWGANGQGQLGDNSTVSRTTPVDVFGLTSGVVSISAGEYHTCAVTTAGGVKCWGRNSEGQLGDNSTTQRTTSVDVFGLTSGVASISAGSRHTCAVMTSGGAKCWGQNTNGQLGNDSTAQRTTPVDVVGLTSGVASVSAGGSHTCAVTVAGGAKCWGYNAYGQLGNGSLTNRNTPFNVFGLTSGVVSVSAELYHTCALTNSGGVKCWGYNGSGQLGDGSTTQRTTPVDVSGLTSGVASVSAGNSHVCAVTTSGSAKCWGHNGSGQLGDNSATQRATPVDVWGLTSGVASVSASGYHTCAVTVAGGAKCWGYNAYGQLGDGTTSHRSVPVSVAD